MPACQHACPLQSSSPASQRTASAHSSVNARRSRWYIIELVCDAVRERRDGEWEASSRRRPPSGALWMGDGAACAASLASGLTGAAGQGALLANGIRGWGGTQPLFLAADRRPRSPTRAVSGVLRPHSSTPGCRRRGEAIGGSRGELRTVGLGSSWGGGELGKARESWGGRQTIVGSKESEECGNRVAPPPQLPPRRALPALCELSLLPSH